MKRYQLCCAVISLFFAHSLFAQTQNLSLQQSIELALQKNIDVIRAQNTVEGQKSTVLSSYGQLLPSLNANAGWSSTETTTPILTNTNKGYSAGLSARMSVFDLSNYSTISKANANSSASQYDLERTRQGIVFETQRRYLQVLRNASLVKSNEELLKRSQQQLARITESNKVGAVAIADVYRQQVQTASDELSLIRSQNAYNNAKTDLQFLLSLDIAQEYEFMDESVVKEVDNNDYEELKNKYANYQEVVKQSLSFRSDYQSSILAKNSAESDVMIARSGHFPSLSANLGYNFSNEELSKISDNKTLTYGVTLSVPLFNGFQTSTQTQLATLRLDNADEQLQQKIREVQVDVKKALLDLESAYKQFEVSQKGLRSAEEERRIAEEKYSLGSGTYLDLLVATSNYSQAVSNKVNASYDYLLAKYQLKYVIGSEKY